MFANNLVRVPNDLSTITQIDRAAECRPAAVGMGERDITRIWNAVEGLYRTGVHPALTLVIRKRGQLVMKRAIGCLAGNGPGDQRPVVALSPDAPICLFSASKAITALLLHKQVERGLLRLDERVAHYLPAFAAHGKGQVTIRQLLAHRAGIPTLPVKHPDPSLLRHWDAMVDLLCMAPPFDPRFEKQAYHALTGGFIVGELVRRVTGQELPVVLREVLTDPLKLKSMTYGLKPERRDQSPHNYSTGPKAVWPITAYMRRIVGVPFERAAQVSNEDAFLSAVVPAGNMFASADDSGRLFQMLLNGGELDGVRVFKPETVAEAVRPLGKMQFDNTLMLPMRFSPGFMLGGSPFGIFGQKTDQAFGHIGFLSVLCWADPQRDISVALLNTGKSIAPNGMLHLIKLIGAINRSCAA